jgi:tetratricopeptide (TPR) repeat protein
MNSSFLRNNIIVCFSIINLFIMFISIGYSEELQPVCNAPDHMVFHIGGDITPGEFLHGTPMWLDIMISNGRAQGIRDNLVYTTKKPGMKPDEVKLYRKDIEKNLITSKRVVPARIGLPDQPWYTMVQFPIIDKNGKDIFQTYDFNSGFRLDNQGMLSESTTYESKEEIIFEPKRAYCFIPPEICEQRLPAGEYTIQAIFDTNNLADQDAGIWRGRLTSAPTKIIVREPITAHDTAMFYVRIAIYHIIFSKNYIKASELLEKAIAIDSTYEPAYSHLAYCQERQGKLAAALVTYEKALALWYQQNPNFPELPEVLIYSIDRIKHKLAQDTVNVK